MMFYQLKRKMTAETDAPTYGNGSSGVNTMTDVSPDTALTDRLVV